MSTIKLYSATTNQNEADDCSVNNIETNDLFDNGFDIATNSDDQRDLPFNNSGNDTIVPRKVMFAMANTKFATMWQLNDSDKKLQNTFISALDQFIDRTQQIKKSISNHGLMILLQTI